MIISHPAVEGRADVGWFLMVIFTEIKFWRTVQGSQGLHVDCPIDCGCSANRTTPPRAPKGSPGWILWCRSRTVPWWGVPPGPPWGGSGDTRFTDQMCLRAGEMFPACASLISKFWRSYNIVIIITKDYLSYMSGDFSLRLRAGAWLLISL